MVTHPEDAIGVAETFGFTNVSIVATNPWVPALSGCGEEDALAVELAATSANGQPVRLVACDGFPFKGWTVRVK